MNAGVYACMYKLHIYIYIYIYMSTLPEDAEESPHVAVLYGVV